MKIICGMIGTALLTVSCGLYGPSTAKPVVKDCIVPTDQTGTINGQWPAYPIPVAFYKGAFSSTETSAMTAAADSWNQFFTASSNIKIFEYGSADSPNVSSATNPTQTGALCAQGIIQNNKFSGNVVVYKQSRWPSNYPQNAMALTSFCFLQAKPYPRLYMAIMEINYQNFFVDGKKLPDLQTIWLHEGGHALGLNHSCEGFQKTGTPNCNDPNLDPDYVSASMFPVFGFDDSGIGQQKRDLGNNDEGRANCLYKGSTSN